MNELKAGFNSSAYIHGERDEVGHRMVFYFISKPAERLVDGTAVIELGSLFSGVSVIVDFILPVEPLLTVKRGWAVNDRVDRLGKKQASKPEGFPATTAQRGRRKADTNRMAPR